MASRLELHEELCELLGSRNVYFNPPESVKMQYDCIRYFKTGMDTYRANDKLYKATNEYRLIVITKNPDSGIPDRIMNHFSMCSYGSPYVADGLNHYPITLYY